MFRIGIIGTENSHAMAFAKLMNGPEDQFADLRVVGVYGPDEESARAIQKETDLDFIASAPEEFFGKVDAMMVTCRKGSLHGSYALPFIQAGMPVFIDKPFTADWEEACALVTEAERHGALLAGGSGCKYAWDALLLKNQRERMVEKGQLLSGAVNFAADRDSIYDGFYFYAPHLTETALTVFGHDVRSVQAFESAGGVVAVLEYDAFHVTLHYTKNSAQSTCMLFGTERNVARDIDLSFIYKEEAVHFAQMLRTGKAPESNDTLIRHVAVIAAVLESLETGKKTTIKRR